MLHYYAMGGIPLASIVVEQLTSLLHSPKNNLYQQTYDYREYDNANIFNYPFKINYN